MVVSTRIQQALREVAAKAALEEKNALRVEIEALKVEVERLRRTVERWEEFGRIIPQNELGGPWGKLYTP